MDAENYSLPGCPIASGVKSVGDAWSFLLLRDALGGLTRFDEFRKNLNIAPTMLTKRLAALTEDGLLAKRRYSERPPRDEYVLTAAGRDFLPVLMLIAAWAQRHRGENLDRYIDDETGLEMQPVAIDAVSGVKLGDRPIAMSSSRMDADRPESSRAAD